MLKPLLLGKEGSYSIFGFQINFVADQRSIYSFDTNCKNSIWRSVSQAAEACLQSRAFRILSLGYVHTFVHEMGHALANKILRGGSASIDIEVNSCKGRTSYKNCRAGSALSDNLVSLAGPLANVIFSVCQVVAALSLSAYLTVPVSSVIVLGATIWIVGELFYAVHSIMQCDHGDFGTIAKRNQIHLILSLAALVTPIALGIFSLRL